MMHEEELGTASKPGEKLSEEHCRDAEAKLQGDHQGCDSPGNSSYFRSGFLVNSLKVLTAQSIYTHVKLYVKKGVLLS